jgi:hypothetical protein
MAATKGMMASIEAAFLVVDAQAVARNEAPSPARAIAESDALFVRLGLASRLRVEKQPRPVKQRRF